MLALDDDRWERLTTYFESGKELPNVLKQWLASIGSDEEATIYGRDLFDLFLHQATITNAAFAVVPWLVDVCKKGGTKHGVEYLTDVALVEANRLKYGVFFNRKGAEEFPEWLMPDYHEAVVDARDLVDVPWRPSRTKNGSAGSSSCGLRCAEMQSWRGRSGILSRWMHAAREPAVAADRVAAFQC